MNSKAVSYCAGDPYEIGMCCEMKFKVEFEKYEVRALQCHMRRERGKCRAMKTACAVELQPGVIT